MHESCVSYLVDTNIKKKHCFQQKITGPLVRVGICRGRRDFFSWQSNIFGKQREILCSS